MWIETRIAITRIMPRACNPSHADRFFRELHTPASGGGSTGVDTVSPVKLLDRLDLIVARFRVLSLGLLMADTGLAARMYWRKSRAPKTRFFCVHGLQWRAVREAERLAGIQYPVC